MKKYAFTLAEVLVTLGIIGVISAMTIPTLVNNYQEQVYVTQLRKVYSDISQAVEKILVESNSVNLRESRLRRDGNDYLLSFFNTTKTCSSSTITNCFASSYSTRKAASIAASSYVPAYSTCAMLASGTSVCFGQMSSDGNIQVAVDLNGQQGPNILGLDLFSMRITNNGKVDGAGTSGNNCVTATGYDNGACFNRVVDAGWNIDY